MELNPVGPGSGCRVLLGRQIRAADLDGRAGIIVVLLKLTYEYPGG